MISHNKWGRHCTLHTQKCSRGFWPKRSWSNDDKSHILPPCCRDNLIEIQHYIHDLFEEHGIEYWMDFGTLLGAVRTGENVEFDNDGDFQGGQGDEHCPYDDHIQKWIDEERPYFEFVEKFEDMISDRFTDPNDEESTELGEIPHGDKKGALQPMPGSAHYWMSYTYQE